MGIFFFTKKIGEKEVTGVHFVCLLLPQEALFHNLHL